MSRKLKTYIMDSGFFELAVAAPSMKAAIERWGLDYNPFSKGFARLTSDQSIVSAAQSKPGLVLRRAIGTKGLFQEHPDLPRAKALKTPRMKKAPEKRQKQRAASRQAEDLLKRAAQRHDHIVKQLESEHKDLTRRLAKEDRQWRRKRKQMLAEIKRVGL